MSRKAVISGRWSICCRNISAATAARRPTNCCAAAPATPMRRACSAPSTRRRRTGCRSSCSPISPTATARCSCTRLAQSGFDPLSRTCRFMLTEEAHHMFVGETGISRIVQRTCEAMKAAGISDPNDVAKVRALGVIDLPTIQKKLNLHYTLSLDLFGSEVSTNAANAFNAGIKGRYRETQIEDDHRLAERHLSGAQAGQRRDQARRRAGADRAQHAAARRLHARTASRACCAGTRSSRHRRLRLQADAAARRVPSPDRRIQGRARDAGRRADRRRHLEQAQERMAAVGRRRRFHRAR